MNGRTLGENIAGAQVYEEDVILPREKPMSPEGGVAVLRGNLAPQGAVIKHTACEPRLLRHTGPAVVFKNYDDLAARIDDPALPVTADSVLVLQKAGPLGAPGMPEWGMLPIPKKLLEQGVRDMVRISDARMSGTSYGACVLHVAPESFVGGPLAFVRDGDLIELDVPARKLSLQRLGRGDGAAARGLEAAGVALPARLDRAVRAARDPGRQGLRLRLPGRHRPHARARDPLMADAPGLPVNAFKRALAEGRTQIGLWTSLGTGTGRGGPRAAPASTGC